MKPYRVDMGGPSDVSLATVRRLGSNEVDEEGRRLYRMSVVDIYGIGAGEAGRLDGGLCHEGRAMQCGCLHWVPVTGRGGEERCHRR